MGRHGSLAFRGAVTSVDVQGELPGIAPLIPQELVVRVAGRPPQILTLDEPGPFSFTVGLPGTAASDFCEISLSPRRTFRPDRHGASTDARELSLLLSLVRATTTDGRQTVRKLGMA
jgi:hypothetical protein